MSASIAPETAEAFTILPGRADAGLVILADHAENTLPPEYGTLGLPAAELQRHIAWDPGVKVITEQLAHRLGVPAVLSRFSRLLIDPNRGLDDPTVIMQISDGAIVPGNRVLDEAERTHRIERFHRPYHAAINRVLDQCLATGVPPTILSLHSFTPVWKGAPRRWHVGILWDADPRLARPLIDGFAADPALIVGDNEPYKGTLRGDTMWTHATNRGLAGALIEYRQDLVGDAAGARAWADRTEALIQQVMACGRVGPALRRIERFGSRSDPVAARISPTRLQERPA
jgi:predicted N-formylglutamate amidohydrolase